PLPWTARQLLLAALVVFLHQFWVSLAVHVLFQCGFFDAFYGPDFVALARGTENSSERELAVTRMNLWAISLAFPFWAVSVAAAYRLIHGLVPDELLSVHGREGIGRPARNFSLFGRNILAGILAWAVLTPLALGVNWLVNFLYQRGGVEG